MAVCNLFNENLPSASGNFLMFSQYVEDITRNYSQGDNGYKIVPSNFIALDIDYSKLDNSVFGLTDLAEITDDILNTGIPRYFQNYFENGCAYGRKIFDDEWTPEMSKNLFWNALWDGKFLSYTKDEDNDVYLINEIMYCGDLNMHSYNNHKGMGYGEIYCYIPTDVNRLHYQVVDFGQNDLNVKENKSNTLEGHNIINNLSKKYFYDQRYLMSFNDKSLQTIYKGQYKKFNINTIVITYDIFVNSGDNWVLHYDNIPLGIYFTGKFEDGKLTNPITKYVTTSYGTGTSYGLRICTRFSVAPNGVVLNTTDVTTDENYVNFCQLMTSMNENLSKMMDIVSYKYDLTNQYKDALSIMKNNRTNVPYVKNINGDDYWFVNGKYVAKVAGEGLGCLELTPEDINDHLNGIPSDDCICAEVSAEELAEKLGIDLDTLEPLPDNDNNNDNCTQTPDIASREEIIDYLDSNIALEDGAFITNDDYLQPVNIVNDKELDEFLNKEQ